MIVAENNNVPNIRIWVEAIPYFVADQTAIEIEYWLFVERGNERPRHTTIRPGVIEAALKEKHGPCASAAADQYDWLANNYPEISGPIFKAHQQRTLANAPASGKINSI